MKTSGDDKEEAFILSSGKSYRRNILSKVKTSIETVNSQYNKFFNRPSKISEWWGAIGKSNSINHLKKLYLQELSILMIVLSLILQMLFPSFLTIGFLKNDDINFTYEVVIHLSSIVALVTLFFLLSNYCQLNIRIDAKSVCNACI